MEFLGVIGSLLSIALQLISLVQAISSLSG
jgi:hypothetical protein